MRCSFVVTLFICVFNLTAYCQVLPPFQKEILAFEERDAVSPPPKGAILFTGSSSIRLWENLQEAFPGIPIINRGFGGSELSDVIRYADRVIIPYQPRQVIIYAGENDIASGEVSAQQVYSRLVLLYNTIHKALPNTSFVFISMKPSPSRRKYWTEVQKGNELIRNFLDKQPQAEFVDVFTPMLEANDPEMFKADSLHMTPKGYVLWAEKLKPVLKR